MPGPEIAAPKQDEAQDSQEVVHEIPAHSKLVETYDWLEYKKQIDFLLTGLEKGMEIAEVGVGDFHKMKELKADTFAPGHPKGEGVQVYIQNNVKANKVSGLQEVTVAVALNNGGDNPKENTVFLVTCQVADGKLALKQNGIIYMASEEEANELLQANISEKDAKKLGRQNTRLTMELFRGNMTVAEYKQEIKKANKGKELRALHEEQDVIKRNTPGIEYLQKNAEYSEFKEHFISELLAAHEEIKNVIKETKEELERRHAEEEEAKRRAREALIQQAKADEEAKEAEIQRQHEEALANKAKEEEEERARHEAEVARNKAANPEQTVSPAQTTEQQNQGERTEQIEDLNDEEIVENAEWVLQALESNKENSEEREIFLSAAKVIRTEMVRRDLANKSGNENIGLLVERLQQVSQ